MSNLKSSDDAAMRFFSVCGNDFSFFSMDWAVDRFPSTGHDGLVLSGISFNDFIRILQNIKNAVGRETAPQRFLC